MKKRWLALTAALLLCLQGLTACTEEAASDTTTTTTAPTTATTAPPVPSGPFHTYLSDEEVATLTASRAETALAVPFCVNGTEAVLEKERGVWFFSVKPGEYWEELTPSAEGFEAQYITPFEEDEKIDVLKANEPVRVLLYNDTAYCFVDVVFTSLPVLSMNTQTLPATLSYFDKDEEQDVVYDKEGEPIPYDPYGEAVDDPAKPIGDYDTFMEVTLLDAEADSHGYDNGFTSKARAHIRGRSSRNYPKNSYKLELLKEEEGVLSERNETLLGMRSDGDWNLNGMYAEPSKVRDKVAADLWLAITEDRQTTGIRNGYRCEYIEVIINGRYHGLYLLTERIDRKQLDLQENDRMYFSEGDLGKWHTDFLHPKDPTDDEISGYSLKWPKEFKEPYTEWQPFGELCKLLDSTGSKEFRETVPEMIDLDSLLDYEIFVQTICGTDNLIQNTFYVARQQEDGSYRFSFLPWDLDQSFGVNWRGDEPYLVYENYEALTYRDLPFWVSGTIGQRNIDGYMDRLKARYDELRDTILSDKDIIKRVNNAQTTLTESGAWARNQQRWPDGAYAAVSRIRAFVVDRMAFLDDKYQP